MPLPTPNALLHQLQSKLPEAVPPETSILFQQPHGHPFPNLSSLWGKLINTQLGAWAPPSHLARC